MDRSEGKGKQQTDERDGPQTVVVTNRHGLHAPPCLAILNTVGRHQAMVTVQKGSQTADAASVPSLMSLAAAQGTKLVLSATGPEATEVLEALVRLFAAEFGVHYTD